MPDLTIMPLPGKRGMTAAGDRPVPESPGLGSADVTGKSAGVNTFLVQRERHALQSIGETTTVRLEYRFLGRPQLHESIVAPGWRQ